MSGRRYDLDWLRVIGVVAVFLFHSMSFFDLEDWSVKNAVTYTSVAWPREFLMLWMMPLIFIVSGASLYYASRKGGAGPFLKDKVLRLLVPLAVGVFTFSIGQVYVERVSHGQFAGSLFAFVPHYFEGVYIPGSTGNFAFHGMHLWYLLLLFVFTLVLTPLLFALRSKAGARAVERVGGVLSLPGALLLLAVPTIVLQNVSETGALSFGLGGWRLVHYLWFLVAGYLVVADERIGERIVQARWVGLALVGAYVGSSLYTGSDLYAHPDLAVWPFLVAILGFGMKHLTFRNAVLDVAGEAVMPFYVLHQNVLLYIGFFVVGWAIPDLAKYAVITLSTLGAIAVTYAFVIRPYTPVRVLFGMKPLRRPALPAEVPLADAAG